MGFSKLNCKKKASIRGDSNIGLFAIKKSIEVGDITSASGNSDQNTILNGLNSMINKIVDYFSVKKNRNPAELASKVEFIIFILAVLIGLYFLFL